VILAAWARASAVVLAQALVFVPLSIVRFIDGDEGSYALAAKLVVQGERPYRDFAYPQMPLLPYVYGAWTALTAESWYSVRVLSALFAVALGSLLYATLASRFGSRLGALGVLLYSSSALVFFWFPTLKTYVVPTFLLFAAYVVVARQVHVPSRRWFLAGVLVALAVDSRLLFASAVPAFAWGAVQAWRAREGTRPLVTLGSGVVVGLAPAWFFLVLDPSRFTYDSLRAYGQTSSGLIGDLDQKVRVLENLVGIGTPAGAVPQFLLLIIGGVTAALVLHVVCGGLPLSLVIAACLAVGNLAPTPTYAQYFCTTVPFLVVAIVELAGTLRERLRAIEDPGLARMIGVLMAVGTVAYVVIGAAELERSVGLYPDQRISSVRPIARIVDDQSEPGERVMASWPGYLFETDALPVKGLESDFAPLAASFLTPAQARHHLRASVDEIERMIREHTTRVVVVKMWHVGEPIPDWWGTTARSGYLLMTEIPAGDSEVGGQVRVYVLDR
jgi:hypothetical protein